MLGILCRFGDHNNMKTLICPDCALARNLEVMEIAEGEVGRCSFCRRIDAVYNLDDLEPSSDDLH